MAQTRKKVTARTTPKREKEAAPQPRRQLNRVGTLVNGFVGEPLNIGQRMAKRRLELQLTQQQIADQVKFTPKTGKRENDIVPLSRNAYCMYETGGVEPDLLKIEALSKALGVTAQWLAFGTGAPESVKQVVYDASQKAFVQHGEWAIDDIWLQDQFGARPSDVALYIFDDFSADFRAGDVAIVSRKATPTAVGGKFVFAYKNTLQIAQVTRNGRADEYRVFTPDLKKHEAIPANKIVFLGKIIGKVGSVGAD